MTNLEKIEKEVAALPKAEMRKFANWFQNLQEELWDNEIETDAISGKLSGLANAALAAHKNGESKAI